MCTQKAPYDYSEQLYERYEAAFNQYINAKVLPTLVEKKGEYMLKSLVARWENHKIMVRWLSKFFNYLDRYYIPRHHFPPLKDVGVNCFRRLVYKEVKLSMKMAVLELIDKERDGEKVDRALIKNVTSIFVEMGLGTMTRIKRILKPTCWSTRRRFTRARRRNGSLKILVRRTSSKRKST